jgi:Uma2 family endonuclease
MAMELQRRPITVDEYHRMAEAGILRDDERVELLRGDIVLKVGTGDRHRACVTRLTQMLILALHRRAAVQPQSSVVVLDDSEPEPDLALLEINEGSIGGTRHAYSTDVFALIDVTDSSKWRDLRFKKTLYAEAGIREYWIVDLVDGVIQVNRDPNAPTQRYRTTSIVRRGDTIAFVAFS